MKRLLAILLMLPLPAYAAGPQKICFDNGGVADFQPGGSYVYDGRDGHYTGKWKSLGKNKYQTNFDNGNSRIDTYEDKGGGNVIDHAPKGDFPGHAC